MLPRIDKPVSTRALCRAMSEALAPAPPLIVRVGFRLCAG